MARKERTQKESRFQTGAHGGCEALLFEFREKHSDEPVPIRIASTSFVDAVRFLSRHEPEFKVDSAQNLGVILFVSGSRVD
jgi:hypothetical protein